MTKKVIIRRIKYYIEHFVYNFIRNNMTKKVNILTPGLIG